MSKYKKSYKNSRSNNGGSKERYQTESSRISAEILTLTSRISAETPASGYAPPLHQSVTFRALPLSKATLRGLEEGHDKKCKSFTTMTAIQNACLPHALAGRDILGAARTGSGKTLAFLVPLLEKLYRERYSAGTDGPGGIVLSPTRELAVQIFQVLRSIGSFHNFSAGLLVGGKKEFLLEQARVGGMNIIVGCPGRVLQHLEETPDFDVSGVMTLVLDEADRILDMGFREQMLRILNYLPKGVRDGGDRQTLLFSATQTKRVADLAALSLYKPEYIGVHDKETTGPTPESLEQSMVVIPLEHKLDTIFSFIKSHLKKKSIIFFSSCSQVRHVLDLFSAMQPGVPLMALHGKLKQEKRTRVYFDFLQRPHAVLFATDVAARGLDFPGVDWVVQADAPEDKEMYIHRVGRTARYTAGGRALLCLLPSEEEGMTKILKEGKIPVKKLSINPTKTVVVSQKACGIVASKPGLNDMAKKAYKSYLRSVSLMPNKDIFKIDQLQLEGYASSLGLAGSPSARFLNALKDKDREELRGAKNKNRKLEKLKEQIKAEKLRKKLEKMGAAGNTFNKKEKRERDVDDVLIVKKRHEWDANKDDDLGSEIPAVDLQQVSASRKKQRIHIDGSSSNTNKRVLFDDDGEEMNNDFSKRGSNDIQSAQEIAKANEDYLKRVKERLSESKDQDRLEEQERIREKRKRQKKKEKPPSEIDEELDNGVMVTLGGESGESSASTYTSVNSDDSSIDDGIDNVQQNEDVALALIRGGTE